MGNANISARKWNKMVKAVLAAEAQVEATPWPFDSDPERDAGIAAYEAAKGSLEAARDALRDALRDAPWGPNGSAFVTDVALRIASSDRIKSVYVNRRLIATLRGGHVEAISEDEAEAAFRTERERTKEWDARYKRELRLLGREICIANMSRPGAIGEWVYHDGQEGGVFYRKSDGMSVSANGAMTEAWGKDWRDSEGDLDFHAEELEIERQYHGARF